MPSIIFFGSSAYSIPVLKTLLDNQVSIHLVVTTPDKPVGRHLQLTPNPLKAFAISQNLPFIESGKLLCERWSEKVTDPKVVGLVAAYGRIIKPELLNKFSTPLINIHPSLLPKYRGPSPLQFQLLDGTTETGVTLIQIDADVDHGPIIASEHDTIFDTDTPETLGTRLFTTGAQLFLKYLSSPSAFKPRAQDHSQATFTQKLTREYGFIPWEQFQVETRQLSPAFRNKFRALFPWPGIWTINPDTNTRVKLVNLSPIQILSEGQSTPQPL